MTASQIYLQDKRGGFDFAGEWQPRHSLDIHDDWWDDWSRDANHDRIDDRLTWLLTQPEDFQSSWWKRADPGQARLFIDYDHHPSTADVRALEALGVSVTMRPIYLDSLIANVPIEMINPFSAILDLPGVVMMEDLGLAETHMNEAVPNMGVEEVCPIRMTGPVSPLQCLTQEYGGTMQGWMTWTMRSLLAATNQIQIPSTLIQLI